MKKFAPLFLFAYLCAAFAIEPFTIADIRVEGLERLEAGTVFNYLPLKVGDELDDEEARISIKELFATGFFKDVALERDGETLVVKVVERPSIATLTISGNSVIDTETLQQGLGEAGLVEGRILNSASLDRVEQEIQSTYLALGRYSTKVTTQVEELERNRVAVTINVDEGRVATIKKVNIIGADKVSKDTVIEQMSLRDRRGWRLFTKRNQYSKQKLEADLEAIRSYYLDRGFHEFTVSSNVDISPNKQNIFISIVLSEGERYAFTESVFESGGASTDGLEELVGIVPGEPFSRKVVNASRAAIVRKYADDGYAFVEVRPIYETDKDAKTVKTVFTIETKQRVYVRRVEITGNHFTRDQVIRREMRQFEGAWYSSKAIDLSRARLQRIGYFESVAIETPKVPGAEDQVDVHVMVKERDTGSVSFSVGYSDADGTLLGADYTQRNLRGTGRELKFSFNIDDTTENGSIAFVDPFHTEDGVSRELHVSSTKVDTTETEAATFQVNSIGGGVKYKIPIAETNSLNLGLDIQDIEVLSTTSTPVEIRSEIDGKPGGGQTLVTLGVSRNTRNDFFFPTKGTTASVSVSMTAPGSEYEYYRFNVEGSYYLPVGESMSLRNSIEFGHGSGFGDTENLPFFRRYFAGGSYSVRGFRARTLGPFSSSIANRTPFPEDMECNASAVDHPELFEDGVCYTQSGSDISPVNVGGATRILLGSEFYFPAFGSAGKDKRFGLFIDGGQTYGEGYQFDGVTPIDDGIDLSKMRFSTGVSFNWNSPIGPFAISYAETLNDEEGDRTENFQINLGATFR